MRYLVIGLFLVLAGCDGAAPRTHFQMVGTPEAQPGVWRLDTQSGELMYCYVPEVVGRPAPLCYRATVAQTQ